MCGWLSARLAGVQTTPANPADIKRYVELAKEAEIKIRHLQKIAADLDWHADASLDMAWEQIRYYDKKFGYTP